MILHNTTFTANERTVNGLIFGVFALGAFTLFLLILAAFIGVVYTINLALDVVWGCCMHIAAIYAAGDPAIKLLMISIAVFVLVKLALRAYRSVRASLQEVHGC